MNTTVLYAATKRTLCRLIDELQRAVGAHLSSYVKHLLSTGVPTSLAGTDGQTALHHAARHGHVDVCQLLLDRACLVGANYRDRRGNTPLHIAAIYGQTKVIQTLIDWGTDSWITNAEGLLARDLALLSGKREAARVCQAALLMRETLV